MKANCKHTNRVYEEGLLASNPTQQRFICVSCGYLGYKITEVDLCRCWAEDKQFQKLLKERMKNNL